MNMNKLLRYILGGIVFLLGTYLTVLEIGITYSEWRVLQSSGNVTGKLVMIALFALMGLVVAYCGIQIIKKKE